MKRFEKEAFLKSFLLFFFVQSLLIGGIYFLNYQKALQNLDDELFSKMRVCSFQLDCKELKIDFVPKEGHELYKLYKKENELSSYFPILESKHYYLKLYMDRSIYNQEKEQLVYTLLKEYSFVLIVVFLLSIGFALYTIAPLRNALHVTEEFIKDILHDFNTPLATLRLNIAMIEAKLPQEIKSIHRIKNSVQTILNLQENLRAYLNAHHTQKVQFKLREFVQQRIELIAPLYKDIDFKIDIKDVVLYTNKEAFTRIIDNLLVNAAKYNKQDGYVSVVYHDGIISIEDSGKGIKNPKSVFQRFYKEQERGIGIGLHIVKKLCDELGINIDLKSKVGEGTTFFLYIREIVVEE